jgi:hypothetical protein
MSLSLYYRGGTDVSAIEILTSLTVIASTDTENRHCRGRSDPLGITVIALVCYHATRVFNGWCLREAFSNLFGTFMRPCR